MLNDVGKRMLKKMCTIFFTELILVVTMITMIAMLMLTKQFFYYIQSLGLIVNCFYLQYKLQTEKDVILH